MTCKGSTTRRFCCVVYRAACGVQSRFTRPGPQRPKSRQRSGFFRRTFASAAAVPRCTAATFNRVSKRSASTGASATTRCVIANLTIAIRCCQQPTAVSNPLLAATAIDARQRSKRSAEHRSAGAGGFGLNDQIPAATPDRSRVPPSQLSPSQSSPSHDLLPSAFFRWVDPLSDAARIPPFSTRPQPPIQRTIDFRHRRNPLAVLVLAVIVLAVIVLAVTNPRNPSQRSNHLGWNPPGQKSAQTDRQIPEHRKNGANLFETTAPQRNSLGGRDQSGE